MQSGVILQVQDSVKIELNHITYRHFNQLKDQLIAQMHGAGHDADAKDKSGKYFALNSMYILKFSFVLLGGNSLG